METWGSGRGAQGGQPDLAEKLNFNEGSSKQMKKRLKFESWDVYNTLWKGFGIYGFHAFFFKAILKVV